MSETTKSTEVAMSIPESMLNRGADAQENIMDSIHSMKVYNAAPGMKPDPETAWHLMIKKVGGDGKYEKFSTSQEINILKIRQSLSGSYPKLDDMDQKIPKGNDEYEREFAFSEEVPSKYFANSNEVFFKSPHGVTRQSFGDLKKLLKTAQVSGRKNPFHKIGLTKQNDTYDSSHINQWYIVYGVFRGGELDGEMFRLLLTRASYGVTFNDWQQIEPLPGTVEYAVARAQDKLYEYLNSTGKKGNFDDSLVRTTLEIQEDGKFFRLNCVNTTLESLDNSEDLAMLNKLLEDYKIQSFGTMKWSYATIDTNLQNSLSIESGDVQEAEVETIQQPKAVTKTTPSASEKIAKQEEISVDDLPF